MTLVARGFVLCRDSCALPLAAGSFDAARPPVRFVARECGTRAGTCARRLRRL